MDLNVERPFKLVVDIGFSTGISYEKYSFYITSSLALCVEITVVARRNKVTSIIRPSIPT